MIKIRRNCKEIERKSFGAKTEQKQGKNRGLWDFVASTKSALCCKTSSQPQAPLCENFRSCETNFGTRVPLRSTRASVSQLRNALRRGKAWFRNKSPIPQRISRLRKHFWHTSAISQHSDPHFAAAKWLRSPKKWKIPISQPHPHFGNCWTHLDHFPKFKLCMQYLVGKIGKSRVHSFKRC